MISKDYIFKEKKTGDLQFVGDFESLYLNESNPWGQSEGRELQLTNFVADIIHDRKLQSYCEIGSGLGYNVNHIKNKLDIQVCGFDISSVAIDKARKNFNLDFRVMNILNSIDVKEKFDCVCLFNCLWYVLDDFSTVINNCSSLLSPDGVFVIAQKYMRDQRYGADIIDGMDGCIKYIENNSDMEIIQQHRFKNEEKYYDGVLVCQ